MFAPALPALLLAAAAQGAPEEVRACWLTQYTYLGKSEAQLRAIAQNIRAGGMNTVYVAMYSGQQTLWPSKAYQAAGGSWTSATIDYADYLVDLFHDEGLDVGAWFEYGLAVGWSSHPVAEENPDWLAQDQLGNTVSDENGGFVFLSPGHDAATDTIVAMVRELAEGYDFDDIQLDRIRWSSTGGQREFGYEPQTSAKYQAQYGVAPPLNVNDPQWVDFREGLINDLFARCYDAIEAANPEIVVSSAPTGYYGITKFMQRWPDWLEAGTCELVLPQMYKFSLGDFVTEFGLQIAAAGPHVDRLGVGYRAQEDDDWTLVRSQLTHARANGIPHAALWVYHQYSAQIAIQDEIDNLPQPGEPWELTATNPFVSGDVVQVVLDNDDPGEYAESGAGWIDSAQPDFFRFGSRVAPGDSVAAEFSEPLSRTGMYDVYAWYTASSNRNDAALYEVHHAAGVDAIAIDQRTGGGTWVELGRYPYAAGPPQLRVRLSSAGAEPGEYTSADAVKLVFRPDAEPPAWSAYGAGCAGPFGTPTLVAAGGGAAGAPIAFLLEGGTSSGTAFLAFGQGATDVPLGAGCNLLVAPLAGEPILFALDTGGAGGVAALLPPPTGGASLYLQAAVLTPGSPLGFTVSNGVALTLP
ncbi:MAG: family 10 glycosylhydrolase [Planctomycetota bacterium]